MKKNHRKFKNFLDNKKDLISSAFLFIVFCGIVFFQHFLIENKNLGSKILQEEDSTITTTNCAGENGGQQKIEKEVPFLSAPRIYIKYYKPETIKTIYLNGWAAGSKRRLEEAIEIAKTTEINALVVDIKDCTGFIFYNVNVAEADKYNAKKILIPDIEAFLEKLHQEEIYVIARIAIFQDPVLAQAREDLAIHKKSEKSSLWRDRSGRAWVDPSAKEVWDYNIAVAKDVLEKGFDEINFDYIRFPADGNLQNMDFPLWDGTASRSLIIKEFFKYLRKKLPGAVISADLFGLTTVNLDDLGIGQIIENAFEYFDYVCPMVYPSHYIPGFLGYQNPAQYPYEVIRDSLDSALSRLTSFNQSTGKKAKLRPWLQDFSLGGVAYDKKMIKAEMQAVYDSLGKDFCGFMLWNPGSAYTTEALQPE